MPEFILRMKQEYKELTERIQKLEKFIGSDTFKYYVSSEKQELLLEQSGVMTHYQRILADRLELEIKEYEEAENG